MRKVLVALAATSMLVFQTSPTIIITHSVPKFFQLSATKMAIVIDEDDAQAHEIIQKVAYPEQQESVQAGVSGQSGSYASTHHSISQTTSYKSTQTHHGEANMSDLFRDTDEEGTPVAMPVSPQPVPQPLPVSPTTQQAFTTEASESISVVPEPESQASEVLDIPVPSVDEQNADKVGAPKKETTDQTAQEEEQLDIPLPSSGEYTGDKVGLAHETEEIPFSIGLANPHDNEEGDELDIPEPTHGDYAESKVGSPMLTSTPTLFSSAPTLLSSSNSEQNTDLLDRPILSAVKPAYLYAKQAEQKRQAQREAKKAQEQQVSTAITSLTSEPETLTANDNSGIVLKNSV